MSARGGIRALLARWQRPDDDAVAAAFEAYLGLLLTWNARINLTGAQTVEVLVSDHLPDSCAMAQLVPAEVQLLDVGSGGGLPAIPFAILRPDVGVALLEPRAKRLAFLRTAVRQLRLPNVEVLPGRLDPHQPVPPPLARFDVLASRATFPPAEWLAVAARVVRPGGRTLVFASRPEPSPVPPPFRLVDEVAYETATHHPRWLGAFRAA